MEHVFKNQIKEKELNGALSFLLGLIAIGSVIHSILTGINSYMWLGESGKYVIIIPIIGTIINAFFIFYFILYKKAIIGVWLFFGVCFISVVVNIIIDINNLEYSLIRNLSQVVYFSLLLLFRKNGESAWKTLMRKDKYLIRIIDEVVDSNEFNKGEKNTTAQTITYILTGVVVVLMIIAIIASI